MKKGFILEKLQSFKKIWEIPSYKRVGMIFITTYIYGHTSEFFFNFDLRAKKKVRNTKFIVGIGERGRQERNHWSMRSITDLIGFYINPNDFITIAGERGTTYRERNLNGESDLWYDEEDGDINYEDYGFIGIMRRNIMVVNPTKKKEVRKNAKKQQRRNRRG